MTVGAGRAGGDTAAQVAPARPGPTGGVLPRHRRWWASLASPPPEQQADSRLQRAVANHHRSSCFYLLSPGCRSHGLAAVSRRCAPPQAAQAERRTPDGGSESVSRAPSRDSKRPDRAGAPAEQRVAARDARSPRKRSSGARRSPAVTRLRLRPDPSVCGLGSARLLLSSRRRGPGYRNGDIGIARRLAAARLSCHDCNHALTVGPVAAQWAKQPRCRSQRRCRPLSLPDKRSHAGRGRAGRSHYAIE
jgi:hypothetical protein